MHLIIKSIAELETQLSTQLQLIMLQLATRTFMGIEMVSLLTTKLKVRLYTGNSEGLYSFNT